MAKRCLLACGHPGEHITEPYLVSGACMLMLDHEACDLDACGCRCHRSPASDEAEARAVGSAVRRLLSLGRK